uniref:Uncharacterized protein n=1 Tax=Graphocephala atropunctata TaxID=36148 RepID=A0A1B6MSX3_9HEMI
MASTQEAADAIAGRSKENLLENLLDQMQKIDLKNGDCENIVIPEWLKSCESPFLWHLQEKRGLGSDHVIARNMEKLAELDIDEPDFSIQRFITLLKLVLEYYVRNEIDKSWETMKKFEDLLEKEASGKNEDYHKTKLSLGHVISSTKVHLLALTGDEDKARKIGQDIIPIKVMKEPDQAALHAMKARFFLYSGYENGESKGVALMRKAYELEPNNPEWEYLLAKMLRQERRDVPFSVDIPREELLLLEKAVEKSRNQKYLVYLAQVYWECGSQAWRQYKNKPDFYTSTLNDVIQKMNENAINYYKEAYELSPDSPAMLRRIGYGIMNLPKKFADYNFALKCLLRSVEMTENIMSLHVLGTFYHRYGNDNVKALEYFEKTAKLGSHAGLCDMVRVKYMLDPEYNPCEDLESGLKWEIKKKYRSQLLSQLGGYFLLIRRNLAQSIKYFSQILADDRDTPYMKTFKCSFLRMYEPINLFHYIINEALLLLQKTSKGQLDSSVSDDEDVEHVAGTGYVEDFVDKLSEIHPELMEITPDPQLVDKLHVTSKEIIDKEKNNFRGPRNNSTPSHRGGYGSHQERGRGRGGRGYHHRGGGASSEVLSERRGRFSVANQRNNENSEGSARNLYGDHSERSARESSDKRGRMGRGRGRRDNNHTNWRKKDEN